MRPTEHLLSTYCGLPLLCVLGQHRSQRRRLLLSGSTGTTGRRAGRGLDVSASERLAYGRGIMVHLVYTTGVGGDGASLLYDDFCQDTSRRCSALLSTVAVLGLQRGLRPRPHGGCIRKNETDGKHANCQGDIRRRSLAECQGIRLCNRHNCACARGLALHTPSCRIQSRGGGPRRRLL